MKTLMAVIGVLLAVVLAVGALGGALGWFSPPVRYEIPADVKGWVVVDYGRPDCAPLTRDGLTYVVVIAKGNRTCTSTEIPRGWKLARFLRVDGNHKTELASSGDTAARMIWAWATHELVDKPNSTREIFFVGSEAELKAAWSKQPTLMQN